MVSLPLHEFRLGYPTRQNSHPTASTTSFSGITPGVFNTSRRHQTSNVYSQNNTRRENSSLVHIIHRRAFFNLRTQHSRFQHHEPLAPTDYGSLASPIPKTKLAVNVYAPSTPLPYPVSNQSPPGSCWGVIVQKIGCSRPPHIASSPKLRCLRNPPVAYSTKLRVVAQSAD